MDNFSYFSILCDPSFEQSHCDVSNERSHHTVELQWLKRLWNHENNV